MGMPRSRETSRSTTVSSPKSGRACNDYLDLHSRNFVCPECSDLQPTHLDSIIRGAFDDSQIDVATPPLKILPSQGPNRYYIDCKINLLQPYLYIIIIFFCISCPYYIRLSISRIIGYLDRLHIDTGRVSASLHYRIIFSNI